MRSVSGYHFYQIESTDEPQGLDRSGSPEEAFITCFGQIRYRMDGGVPSAIFGHILYDGMNLRLTNVGQIEKFRFVKYGEGISVLSITLEKE